MIKLSNFKPLKNSTPELDQELSSNPFIRSWLFDLEKETGYEFSADGIRLMIEYDDMYEEHAMESSDPLTIEAIEAILCRMSLDDLHALEKYVLLSSFFGRALTKTLAERALLSD